MSTQHIVNYCKRIEAILAKRSSGKAAMKDKKGLLAPSGVDMPSDKKERNQLETIADIVEGIRQAREEILNAKG